MPLGELRAWLPQAQAPQPHSPAVPVVWHPGGAGLGRPPDQVSCNLLGWINGNCFVHRAYCHPQARPELQVGL